MQSIGALVASIAGLTLVYRQYVTTRVKDETTMHSESAVQAQFAALREAITQNRKEASDARAEAASARVETAELRHEFARMDRVIHSQQRTITRMEMLLRQFAKLVQEGGTVVPKHMKDEMHDLVEDSESLLSKVLNSEVKP
jgi:chromosome segregation ATPase